MKASNLFIFGKHAVSAAVEQQNYIKKIYISKQVKSDYFKEISKKILKTDIELFHVELKQIQSLAPKDSVHQGVLAEVNEFPYQSLDEIINNNSEKSFIIVLDQITDPHNLGAIIRTAECSGASAIMIPDRNSASINSTVIKTSTGAVFNIPIIQSEHLYNDLNLLKQNGYFLYSAAGEAKEDYTNLDFPDHVVLIIGNEEIGIRKQIRNISDELIKIPIHGKTESLNASVAAGILIYSISNKLFN
jgi:23S rRNA (guanosine2251-2'-O)-methyltransferase